MGNNPLAFQSPQVPILNQPCAIHDVQPDVIVSCTCDGPLDQRLIRLRRWDDLGTCRACKRGLKIKRFAFDAATGQVQVELLPMIAQPVGPTQ
jgi:hypothetical protein